MSNRQTSTLFLQQKMAHCWIATGGHPSQFHQAWGIVKTLNLLSVDRAGNVNGLEMVCQAMPLLQTVLAQSMLLSES